MKFKKDQKLTYVGRGFIGFDKSDTEMIFDEYEGDHDAFVFYKSNRMLVFKHEITTLNK